jgi:serine/threonine protein kinase
LFDKIRVQIFRSHMIGSKLAHYEITAHLGSGGMGDVYQATDTKLGRSVAIKFLPEAFTHDTERVARFQREARVLASLNHPNIAAIHGVEEVDIRHFLVMELVPGETLADRIKRGAIPIEEALPIAKQIADALEKAHEKGIIHRDLKPANIKVTPDGKVKVLDFGLAKAYEPGQTDVTASNSPTVMSMAATNAGVILGTAAYMSPEQAKGRPVDRRADIWAFGCVLFEMLTGEPAFGGDDIAEILSRVLQREPDWTKLPAAVPARVRELLRLCLEKNVKGRRSDSADVRIDIEQALEQMEKPGNEVISTLSAEKTSRLPWIVAASAAVIATVLTVPAARYMRSTSPQAPETRLQLELPESPFLFAFALSPDGQYIVYAAERKLWLRPMDSDTAERLDGTEDTSGSRIFPFWSPDSRSIGFFVDNKLKRIDLSSHVVRTITDIPGWTGMGGTWNSRGTIVFGVSGEGSPLYSVPADGGTPSPVTRLGEGHRTHRFPQFLPDGRHFIFVARTTTGPGIYVGSLASTETQRLMDSDASAVFAGPDQILFSSKGALLAQRLDLKNLKLVGSPVPVSGQIAGDWSNANTSLVGFSLVTASANGLLAYRPNSGRTHLVVLDRSGHETAEIPDSEFTLPDATVSPDQKTLGVTRDVGGNVDVWLLDIDRGLPRRMTADTAFDGRPIWSPDGKQIAFVSTRKGVYDIYLKSVDANDEKPLLESPTGKVVDDWSKDGKFILYQESGLKTQDDLWALPLSGDRKPFVVLQTPNMEYGGRFSPDSHWIAYISTETGRGEVYVQSFPGGENRQRISLSGAFYVEWRSDGRELYFVSADGQLMAVPVTTQGNTLKSGPPVSLFRGNVVVGTMGDGQRFIGLSQIEPPAPLTVLLNWKGATQR